VGEDKESIGEILIYGKKLIRLPWLFRIFAGCNRQGRRRGAVAAIGEIGRLEGAAQNRLAPDSASQRPKRRADDENNERLASLTTNRVVS
jgi:hypothetical protein